MLSVKNLTKIYKLNKKKGGLEVVALDNVSIDFPEKGLVFLLGKSGSGKSTLLNSIGGLDTFDKGEIIIKGKSSRNFKQRDFDSYRNTFIGFIFQEYNILDEFTVGKNLALALELQGKKADRHTVEKLLEQVGLAGYYKRKPNQLSGGQKQRVAIARALIKEPEIIMADEPTGALDSNTGKQVMETLKKLSQTKLVIVVSHDREFAEFYGDRIIELKDGHIISDTTKKEVQSAKVNSNVSVIDKNIIHIKQGQKLTDKDVENINKILTKKDGDIFISLDNNTNKELKRAASITDDGNREVFKDTEQDDIVTKEYNPKDFKLIRSRFKFKDSFKIGASSLKHKPIRLIFTILLSVCAFCMFGLVSTFASFNKTDTMAQTLHELGTETVVVDSERPIFDEEYTKLTIQNSSHKILPVIHKRQQLNYKYRPNPELYPDRYTSSYIVVNGITYMDADIANSLGLKLDQTTFPNGHWPQNANEICLTPDQYAEIKNPVSDNYTILLNDVTLQIVGVYNSNVNLKELNKNPTTNHNKIYMEEKYGFSDIALINKDTFDAISAENEVSDVYYYLKRYNSDQIDDSNRIYAYPFSKIDSYYIQWKDGVNKDNLKPNQIIVSSSYFYDFDFGGVNPNAKDLINSGLTVSIDMRNEFTFEIVGYSSNGYTFIDDEVYKYNYYGYDFAIVKLNKNNSDKTLVKNVLKMGDGIDVVCEFSDTINMFSDTFNTTKQILLYVAFGFALFAMLMLMNFIAVSITYKKHEIGILRAIGARGKDVFFMFFWEAFLICIINFVLATIACGVCCFFINRALTTELNVVFKVLMFGLPQIALIFAVSFVTAVLSSLIPVWRIARKNPIDSINNR